MSHIAGAAAYEYEISSDDGNALQAHRYIQGVINISDGSGTEDENAAPSTDTKHAHLKGKRKAGQKVEWSDDESENAYEKFKNRASTKRKKTAATRKKAASRLKNAVVGRRQAKLDGGGSKAVAAEEDSDFDMMEDSLPEYLLTRRKQFDANKAKMRKAGLQLPPDYDDIEFSEDERLLKLQERPDFSADIKASREYKDIQLPQSSGIIPAPISQYLRDYQVQGVAFLHELFVYQKGGILGDDMGLGKTVQVAAFLAAAFGKTGDERDFKRMRKMRRAMDRRWYPRVLIVCPGTLIENWKQELGRWGYWHVDSYHGSGKEDVFQAAKAGRLEILITTYTTYKMNKSQLNLIEWDCVVADECHILKERTSETTQAMNEVNALCRIGLTGTAIQNKYEELWTLLNWTNPGRFGPLSTWKSSICLPLAVGQSHDASIQQLSIARKTAKKLVENLLPQFFLRRMKSLIAHQLPKKSDRVVFCPLTGVQRDAYERFLDGDFVDLVKHSADPCECMSGKKRGWCCHATLPGSGIKWQALVFPVIATLQKLSNHLALLIPSSTDPQEKQTRDLDFLQTMVPDRWEDLYNHRDSIFNLSNPEFCGKWRVLKRLLRFWHGNGDKVLVFSHSVKLLKMLQHLFHNTAYNVSFLDGSLSYEDRQRVVDDFNSDPGQFVFLISTKAGGVGLNITSANKVVIFDPNWNPSYDLQAQDRAYRIGQTRDVEVFRLISAGTVEEIVYARQIYKQQQANIGYNASLERRYFKGVQNQKGQKGEIFGLANLLRFHSDEVVLRDIVNKTNVAEAKAGVGLIDIDMNDADATADDDIPFDETDMGEDAALSQLVDKIIGDFDAADNKPKSMARKPKRKVDAISAILASAGVEYTHENSEVVGSSKVEERLSRRAEAAIPNSLAGERRLFDDDDDHGGHYDRSFSSDGRPSRKYVFRPPPDVLKRQFCTMARTFGFDSATSFALVVEGWTTEQRRGSLERFYRLRREKMETEGEAERMRGLMERGRRVREEREKMEREGELEPVAEDREDEEEGAKVDVDWEGAVDVREGATKDADKAYMQGEREGTINDTTKASARVFTEGASMAVDEAATTGDETERGSEVLNPLASHQYARSGRSEADDTEKIQGIPEPITSSEDEDDQL
ncbi:hypothetical protein V500_00377 [Pseudogymnoascus sp. VKM F-4518 (FW-2643)]|nr:hypothetical protein V500_00377 [Pseudogymnoascus sp. VKM F-4518 (FW-2643)]